MSCEAVRKFFGSSVTSPSMIDGLQLEAIGSYETGGYEMGNHKLGIHKLGSHKLGASSAGQP